MNRGDRRELIFNDDKDRECFLKGAPISVSGQEEKRLRPLHEIPTMRSRLIAEVRGVIPCPENPPPLTEEEKARLMAHGWAKWIVDLVNLPPFSNESAKDWYGVGWAALKEMAGGNVATIKELRPAGESRAKEWRDQDASVAQQENQRECSIHDQLLKSFLHRFRLAE
jgi:hypothetical protein